MLSIEEYQNIFHEIKNSITLISSSLQLVEKKHPEVADFSYWAETMSEITSLRNMVTELSSAGLCDHLNLKRINLYKYMEEIRDSVSAFAVNDFHCEVTMDDGLPEIDFDPLLIKQALINLLKNAYEAMNESGTAIVHVSRDNQLVLISVTDHGGGLNPSFADSIFEPFITSKNGGSGLGLVITKQIVEAHQGTIQCVSRPDDGCTFTISLPVTQN